VAPPLDDGSAIRTIRSEGSAARAIRPNSNDRLAIGHQALTTRTSLRLSEQLTIGSWQHVGRQISLIHNSSAWWLGDWLIYGESRYPDRYRKALAGTCLEYKTLRNYAWVARSFAAHRRRPDLSFQHHAEVAALQKSEQDRWLDLAQRNGWSKARLRRELRPARQAIGESQPLQLKIEVREDQRLRWRKAAADAESDLENWIISILDAAASTLINDADIVFSSG